MCSYDVMNTNGIFLCCLSSVLAYDPTKRWQIWRFFSYMLLHASWDHIGFNCLMQVVVGEGIGNLIVNNDLPTYINNMIIIQKESLSRCHKWAGKAPYGLPVFTLPDA